MWLVAAPCGVLAQEQDLVCSMAEIPGQIESADRGAFVELVKAIDGAYAQGSITRRIFPFARSIENVLKGEADFHIPMLVNPHVNPVQLPYRVIAERLGVVEFVLYSNAEKPLTREQVDRAPASGGRYPYVIEGLRGTDELGAFPLSFANSVEQGLRKVAVGRIDGFFMAQEDGDGVLRRLRLKTVHRALYGSYDDVIMVARTPRGDEVDRALSAAIRALKNDGRWTALYERVHRPYDDWQPAQQGW